MNCRVCLAVRTSLSNDRQRRSGNLFSGLLFEIYRNCPGSPPVFWKPSPEHADFYSSLKKSLELLPRVLVTVVKRSCNVREKAVPYSTRRQGSSLVHLLVHQIQQLNSRPPPTQPTQEILTEVRDELTFVATFPTTEYDYSLYKGLFHAMTSLENDLQELREMLLNERNNQSDVAAIVYDCRRILRKANLIRWVVSVFLYTCLPLLNQPWSSPQNDLQEHLLYKVRQGLERLGQLECLVQPFWNHRSVKSALREKPVEGANSNL